MQSFDVRDERAVQAALKCQRLLGPTPFTSKPDEIQRQQFAGTGGNLYWLDPW